MIARLYFRDNDLPIIVHALRIAADHRGGVRALSTLVVSNSGRKKLITLCDASERPSRQQ